MIHRLLISSLSALLLNALPAMAGSNDRVFIPLGSDNAIVIINPDTSMITGKIHGISNAHGLAKTPDNRHLIAGSYDERDVGSASPKKPDAVSQDEHAAHHAKSVDGKHKKATALSTVSVIRLKDRTVIRHIDVPGAVHHVAVNPGGTLAIVTHPNQDAISLIDLAAHKVVATVATGPSPNYAAFSPDGRHAYVSNTGNNTVSDVDVAKRIVLRNFPVGDSPEHLVLSKDGAHLFVNNINAGTVSAIDVKAGRVSKTYRIGSSPLHGIDLSDDEKVLYVAALADDAVAALDLASGTLRKSKLSPAPYHLTTIHGTGRVFVSSAQEPKLWVLDAKSLKVTGEITIGGKGHQMVLVTAR